MTRPPAASDAPFSDSDSASFRRSFERWRTVFTQLAVPATSPLRCDQQQPTWDQGTIMQEMKPDTEKSDAERKRDAADCKRCEKWRDELARDSQFFPPKSGVPPACRDPAWNADPTVFNQVRSSGSCSSTSRSCLRLPIRPCRPRNTLKRLTSRSQSPAPRVRQRWPAATRPRWASSCAKTGS